MAFSNCSEVRELSRDPVVAVETSTILKGIGNLQKSVRNISSTSSKTSSEVQVDS